LLYLLVITVTLFCINTFSVIQFIIEIYLIQSHIFVSHTLSVLFPIFITLPTLISIWYQEHRFACVVEGTELFDRVRRSIVVWCVVVKVAQSSRKGEGVKTCVEFLGVSKSRWSGVEASYRGGKMFDDWKIKMKVAFQFQDVVDVIETGLGELNSKAIEEDKKNYKLQQKLDGKARFLLYQCVNSQIFNKISQAETTKEAWEIFIKTYGDGNKHKKVKLQV